MENKNIIFALCEAKKEFKAVVKEKTNPFFKSKYADLENYLDATEQALCKNGLFITQTIGSDGLTTAIRYAYSQDTITSTIPIRETKTPQELGSQLTYLRRYSYAAILGLASEDDDANESSKTPAKIETPNPPEKLIKSEEVDTSILPHIKKKYEYVKDRMKYLDTAIKHIEENNQDAVDYKAAFDWIVSTKNKLIKEVKK